MLVSSLDFIRCPVCGKGRLAVDRSRSRILDNVILEGILYCVECEEEYEVLNGFPNLLSKKIKQALRIERTKKRIQAIKKLQEIISFRRLTESEKNIVDQIIASDNMAPKYRNFVVDSTEAAPLSAYMYERYEDLFLRDLLEKQMKELMREIVFIEVGSGPGRYLVQFGARMTKREDACLRYRIHPELKPFYLYDRTYEEKMRMIIGIDFSQKMIESALEWLETTKLNHLLDSDTILQIIAAAQHLVLDFRNTDYQDTYKIVTCMFQTIGNQMSKELQIQLLKKMKEFAQPKGTVVLSVFNKSVFDHYIEPYYQMIKDSIGELSNVDKKEKTITTEYGVYSRWLDEEEIFYLFKQAGYRLKKVKVRVGTEDSRKGGMPKFPKDYLYVPKAAQTAARERGIIATADIE